MKRIKLLTKLATLNDNLARYIREKRILPSQYDPEYLALGAAITCTLEARMLLEKQLDKMIETKVS